MSDELKDDSQRSLFDKKTLAVYGAMNRLSGRLSTVRIEMRDTAASQSRRLRRRLRRLWLIFGKRLLKDFI